ncbi:MAG: DNA mismatch repair endonuclease MutL [Bacillota bacterium]|nr:DNA mismatch repair endonuclease MutL [Bacillota bacterium]
MSSIHVLSEHLTNMIAAGEVVERPAGIVKECVENSIDAHAKTIEIEVFQGGIESLIITDDGIGMDYEDAHMAFMRHATSKMRDEEDLFNIGTMGFRGEAIPSIASVAHVDLQTNNGKEGSRIVYDYGELVIEEHVSVPKGTRIEISGLFLKTPARFKHLKSYSYEFSVISDLINKMALSHPEIRFILSQDGRVVFQTSGNGNIKEIIYQMYGNEVAKCALEYENQNDDFKIKGLVIQPKISRATKYFMFISLNTRLIRSVPIQKAILDAYSDYMPPNRFPIVVLQIETDTQLVDVNVHPNKWEVRLSKQGQLVELIKDTIRNTLDCSLKTVEVKERKNSAPIFEQPSLAFPYPVKAEEKITEKRVVKTVPKKKEEYSYIERELPKQKINIEESFGNYHPVVEKDISYPTPVVNQNEKDNEKGKEFFYHLQVLAQLHDSYILCSNENGLVVVDQHAAQERYHYEQIKEVLQKPCTNTQPLMLPIQINVTPNVLALLEEINEKISFFGLHFEQFGDDQVIVREIPLWFQDVYEEEFLQDLIDFFIQNKEVDMANLRKHVLATMACHSSIRFNRPLTMDEMKQVITDLQKCKQPYHCPHGRPTVITISNTQLRKEFERE